MIGLDDSEGFFYVLPKLPNIRKPTTFAYSI